MLAKRDDVIVPQGATYRRVYQLLDTDLTGYAVHSQFRDRPNGTVLLDLSHPPVNGSGITVDVQQTDDGRPITILTVLALQDLTTPLAPGTAVHDIKITSPGGEADRIVEGIVMITAEVTQ